MVFFKIVGIVLIMIGFLIVKSFPGISAYQSEKMSWTGVFIGLIVLFGGVALLFF